MAESATSSEAAGRREVSCPRCGYDLRGAIASWAEECPLTGRCTECGLDMAWAEVLRPDKFEPRWCVEFRRSGRFTGRAWRTFWMSLRPWRFWDELKMSHEIRWRRIAGYLLLLLAPFLLLYVVEQTAFAVRGWQIVHQLSAAQQQQAAVYLPRVQKALAEAEASGEYTDEQLTPLRLNVQQWQAAKSQPAVLTQSLAGAIGEAVFTPLASVSSGTIQSAWGNWPYPAPVGLHEFVIDATLNAVGRQGSSIDDLDVLVIPQVIILPLFVGIPIGFVLLPISRRRAKVRWRHIGRVTAYSLSLPIVIAQLVVLAIVVMLLVPRIEHGAWQSAMLLANGVLWLGLLVWWAIAIWRYLKIPHGWAVAPVLALLTVVLQAALMFYIGKWIGL